MFASKFAQVKPYRCYVIKSTGQRVSVGGAAPHEPYDVITAGYTVYYPILGESGHGCFAGMTEEQAEVVARRYTANQESCLNSIRAYQTRIEEAEKALPLDAVEVAKTYSNGWQWRATAHGCSDFVGYYKTKKAALADGRKTIATYIANNT